MHTFVFCSWEEEEEEEKGGLSELSFDIFVLETFRDNCLQTETVFFIQIIAETMIFPTSLLSYDN